MTFIVIIGTILYIIWLSNLINAAFKMANRIAVASEASAEAIAILIQLQTSQLGYSAVEQELR